MPLEPVPQTPGLWRDPQWRPGMPGVYALVCGISDYPFMDGGRHAPAADAPSFHMGMGQLHSSANTAAGIFGWLRDGFQRQDLPVVWCMLLLAPNGEEKAAFDTAGLAHYAEPHNDGLRKAIQMWTGNVPREAPAAPLSRTLFFFSGHGVQAHWDPLLLPSDYLDTTFGQPVFENCIAAAELRKWMEEHPAAEHLALIDACRNDYPPLTAKGATANSCFPLNPAGPAPRTAATLHSTLPGAVAYQVAGRPYTFFGEAVLEALRGSAAAGDTQLVFRELVDYVKPRVNLLLRQVGATAVEQSVRPRIDGDDGLVVTELPPDSGAGPDAAAPPPPPAAAQPGLAGTRRRGRRVPSSAAVRAATDARFDAALATQQPVALDAVRQDMGLAHQITGHEYASFLWTHGLAVLDLDDGQPVADAATVVAVQRNERSSLLQVDLLLAPRPRGLLWVFEGRDVQRGRLAMALPTDPHGPLPLRMTLAIAALPGDGWPRLQKLEARLGPGDAHSHYATLWELTREADLGSLAQAAQQVDPAWLLQAAQDGTNGQAAAVAGMLLLARAGQLGRAHDGPRRLLPWCPRLPDAAVLWAEALRQALARGERQPFGIADPQAEIAAALATLPGRGLPFFAESIELADGLARQALRHAPDDTRLQAVAGWLARVFDTALPGGHFSVLAELEVDAMLRLLRGPG